MTNKARIADELLFAAMNWQNGHPTYIRTSKACALGVEWDNLAPWPMESNACGADAYSAGASACLSEAAGLGYDLVDADTGEPCEKVKVFT
jgi:hypothetical protein